MKVRDRLLLVAKAPWHPMAFLRFVTVAIFGPRRSMKERYQAYMDYAALVNPKASVGVSWEVGSTQLHFLEAMGLKKEHKLLDLGCGCLRGGIHFIRFLAEGNYYGMDIAANQIGVGRRLLAEERLLWKNPTLIVNRDLLFNELAGVRFDYIWAHSVFTHMPLDDISECFEHLHKILAKHGAFFATYLDGGSSSSRRGLFGGIFYYPLSVFQELAEKYGCVVSAVPGYPSVQGVMKICWKTPGLLKIPA